MQQSVPWGLDNLNPCRDKKKDVFQTVTPLFFSWLAFMTWKHLKVFKDVLFFSVLMCVFMPTWHYNLLLQILKHLGKSQ